MKVWSFSKTNAIFYSHISNIVEDLIFLFVYPGTLSEGEAQVCAEVSEAWFRNFTIKKGFHI